MKYLFFVWLLFSLCNSSFGQRATDTQSQEKSLKGLPEYVGYVNDFENILTDKQEKELSEVIRRFEKRTSNQIAIITVDSITPYTNMKGYATNLANKWGVGQKDKNNGLLIVVSSKLRQTRIATGLGTEKVLTDQICQRIIDEQMIPFFKKGEYYKGLQEGLTELISNWK
jgi:uncharacterized protein